MRVSHPYAEFLKELNSTPQATMHFGLELMGAAVQERELQRPAELVITIAGTNGKGTVAAALNQLCVEAGLRTTLLTSPHLVDFRERIRLDRRPIEAAHLCEIGIPILQEYGATSGREPRPLSYFELSLLLGLEAAKGYQSQVCIIEVGLGGRLDAANAIDADISVFTSMSLDHTEILGSTVSAIAKEKAGIARSGQLAFVHRGFSGSTELENILREVGATLRFVEGNDRSEDARAKNFELARAVFQAVLQHFEIEGSRDAEDAALSKLRWPGRQSRERTASGQSVFLDGAHNHESALELQRVLRADPLRKSSPAVVSLSVGRSAEDVLLPVLGAVSSWHVCAPDFERVRSARELAEELAMLEDDLARRGASVREVHLHSSVEAALHAAAHEADRLDSEILVFGSLYLVGEAYIWLGYGEERLPSLSSDDEAQGPVAPANVAEREANSHSDRPPAVLGKGRWEAPLLVPVIAILGMVCMSFGHMLVGMHMPFYLALAISTTAGNFLPGVATYLALKKPIEWPVFRRVEIIWAIRLGIVLSLTGALLTGLISDIIAIAFEGSAFGVRWEDILAEREALYENLLQPEGVLPILAAYIAIAVFPGIFEEFFYRGALYKLVEHLPYWWGIIGIGTLFGLIHFDFAGLVPLVLFGITLTWMRARTGSWGMSAVTHIVFNATSLTVALLATVIYDESSASSLGGMGEDLKGMSLAALFFSGIALFQLVQFARQVPPTVDATKKVS